MRISSYLGRSAYVPRSLPSRRYGTSVISQRPLGFAARCFALLQRSCYFVPCLRSFLWSWSPLMSALSAVSSDSFCLLRSCRAWCSYGVATYVPVFPPFSCHTCSVVVIVGCLTVRVLCLSRLSAGAGPSVCASSLPPSLAAARLHVRSACSIPQVGRVPPSSVQRHLDIRFPVR